MLSAYIMERTPQKELMTKQSPPTITYILFELNKEEESDAVPTSSTPIEHSNGTWREPAVFRFL